MGLQQAARLILGVLGCLSLGRVFKFFILCSLVDNPLLELTVN